MEEEGKRTGKGEGNLQIKSYRSLNNNKDIADISRDNI